MRFVQNPMLIVDISAASVAAQKLLDKCGINYILIKTDYIGGSVFPYFINSDTADGYQGIDKIIDFLFEKGFLKIA